MTSQIQKSETVAVRRRKLAARLQFTENRKAIKNNPSKEFFNEVLSKVVAKHDPLLSVKNYDKFVAENVFEFNNLNDTPDEETNETEIIVHPTVPKSTVEREQSLHSTFSNFLNQTPEDTTQADPPLVKVDELSIVTPNLCDPYEIEGTTGSVWKNYRKVKSYRSLKLRKAATIGEYVMAKYAQNKKKYKRRRFSSNQMVYFRKLRNPCFRKYLTVKHPHVLKMNLHKYSSIRRSYIVNPSRDKFKHLSLPSKQLYTRWQKKNLPKIHHNSELLRELTLHWTAIRDEHFQTHGSRLPDLTVQAADVIATAVQVFIRNQIKRNC